jgi:hypothetical protein
MLTLITAIASHFSQVIAALAMPVSSSFVDVANQIKSFRLTFSEAVRAKSYHGFFL